MKILVEKAVIEQVLEALGGYDSDFNIKNYDLITALREALNEQAEQEPVAWCDDFEKCKVKNLESYCHSHKVFQMMKKYAAPVRTKDLTDDEIETIFEYWYSQPETKVWSTVDLARAVIAADREKNK